jgi:hypothetical protein
MSAAWQARSGPEKKLPPTLEAAARPRPETGRPAYANPPFGRGRGEDAPACAMRFGEASPRNGAGKS